MDFANMVVQVGLDCETAITIIKGTLKRFHALMESQMLPQMGRLREGLSTDLA